MIVSIRDLLLESDFSMCLAYLLNYEPPEDLSLIITKGIQIKRDILNIEESKNDDDGFGFEDLDGEVNQMRANSATKLEKITGKKLIQKMEPQQKKKFFPNIQVPNPLRRKQSDAATNKMPRSESNASL